MHRIQKNKTGAEKMNDGRHAPSANWSTNPTSCTKETESEHNRAIPKNVNLKRRRKPVLGGGRSGAGYRAKHVNTMTYPLVDSERKKSTEKSGGEREQTKGTKRARAVGKASSSSQRNHQGRNTVQTE